jgi:hypothetical protein
MSPQDPLDPERLPTEDLPLLPPDEERGLGAALKAAFSPEPMPDAQHEALLMAAIEDPFAPPSAEELEAAEALRKALDEAGEPCSDVAEVRLLRALALAAPSTPLTVEAERAHTQALEATRPRSNVVWVAFGVAGTVLSAAAAVLLLLGPLKRAPSEENRPELALSRSLAPLMAAEVTRPSERIDRIATVRARELRENRFAVWGVR